MATAKKKVWILDGGSLVIDRSQVLWHIDVGTPVRFPVYSVLIEHPDGLFMYDTGYDLDHVNRILPFELPEQTPDQTIPAQLKAAGFDPEQVNFVVNSHFHFDHVGGNKYLTGATTLVNTAELRHAKVPEPFEHLGYSDLSFDFPGTIVPFVPWEELDFAEWRRVMSVNIDGVFLTCKAVYPYMKEAGYGRIVNICSNVVTAGTPNMAHYVASKGAVFSFTRSLATEVGQYGITVNAVAPGLTASEGVLESPHAGAFDFVVSLQSIPRRGVPDDIAPAVAFLASEEAHWITGQMLTADGGHTRH